MLADWPLSAATTHVLFYPKPDKSDVLKLALKELVLVGAWRLEKSTGAFRLSTTWMLPTGGPVPERSPLRRCASQLHHRSPQGGPVAKVVKKAGSGFARDVCLDSHKELVGRGLLVREQERFLVIMSRQRTRRTPLGEQWVAAFAGQERHLWMAMQVDERAALAQVAACPALLLLVSDPMRQVIDQAVRRQRDNGGGGGGGAGGGDGGDVEKLDMRGFDSFDSIDSGFDSAVDAGGGGDGGGGDGGGGGGD